MNRNSGYGRPKPHSQFDQFQASSLFCPTCGTAQPVSRRLLLVLPDGDLFGYHCQACGTSVGTQRNRDQEGEKKIILV